MEASPDKAAVDAAVEGSDVSTNDSEDILATSEQRPAFGTGKLDGDAQSGSVPPPPPPPPPVSYWALYRYATSGEVVLAFLGVVCAVANGAAVPVRSGKCGSVAFSAVPFSAGLCPTVSLQGFAVLFGLLLDAVNQGTPFVELIKQIALAFTLVVRCSDVVCVAFRVMIIGS
jgi:hypothetical protein